MTYIIKTYAFHALTTIALVLSIVNFVGARVQQAQINDIITFFTKGDFNKAVVLTIKAFEEAEK
jgi:hypothetical protein